MGDVAELLDKDRVDPQNRVVVALGLDYVADGEGSKIAAVFKVSRVESFQPHFVEDLATFGPFRKYPGGPGCRGTGDVGILVVLLGSPDDAVLDYVLHDLDDFGFRERQVHDEAGAVLDAVLLASGSLDR